MKVREFELYNNLSTGENPINYPDFKVGDIYLAKHLNITDDHGVLIADKRFGKQLLLKEPSELNSGRVPLCICCCCHDLGCGALTVKVTKEDGYFVWKEFGYENNYEDRIHQSNYMKRTGPFFFESTNYISVIHAYCN